MGDGPTSQILTLRRTFRDAIRPPPRLSVSEWADAERVLVPPATPSAWCGPWRTDVAPFLREPMDRMGPYDPCRRVVLMLPSQIGKSEILNNCAGFYVAAEPASILVVQPTEGAARAFSRERLDPMIAACPALSERVAASKSRDSANTLGAKTFAGGHLAIVGANAPTGLASRSRRVVLVDEVDRCPAEVGAEGDVIAVVEQRAQNHADAKVLLVSTPTILGESLIHRAYLEGDQRLWLVDCPACGAAQELVWERQREGRRELSLVWVEADVEAVAYACEDCGVVGSEAEWKASPGRWEAQAEGDGATRSYHLEALASPFVAWSDLVRRWLGAGDDPALMQPFTNLVRGLPWDAVGSSGIDADSLLARREVYVVEPLPAGVQVLTAAVDVQDDRLEVGVWGWGAGEEAWAIEHVQIYGDPSGSRPWADVERYILGRRWGGERIRSVCCDTGGHHTSAAYGWCKRLERASIGVYAIKGQSGQGLAIWPRKPSPREVSDIRPALYLLGVDSAKERIYARLKAASRSGPGAIHLPVAPWCDQDWCDQLTSEVRKTVLHSGRARARWVKPDHRRNEALDLAVYALAALHAWVARGNRLRAEAKVEAEAQPKLDRTASPVHLGSVPQPRRAQTRERGAGRGAWLR